MALKRAKSILNYLFDSISFYSDRFKFFSNSLLNNFFFLFFNLTALKNIMRVTYVEWEEELKLVS